MKIHISFNAEELFQIGPVHVTNSLLTGIIAVGLISLLIILIKSKLNVRRPGTLEIMAESVYDGLYSFVNDILGEQLARRFFAFLVTFFIIILAGNWLGLLPIVPSLGLVEPEHEVVAEESVKKEQAPGTVKAETLEEKGHEDEVTSVLSEENGEGEKEEEFTKGSFACLLKGGCYLTTHGIVDKAEFKPIFRAPTADLSQTLALALISVIVTNIVGLSYNGFGYMKKYFDFSSPIMFVVGILEFISELGKIVSFAFRLFGNVFAGEVLLTVITAISFGVATMPFLGLEIFVGAIQALVFFLLTTVFIGLAASHHHS